MEYQHKWNTQMEGQYKAKKINISNVPSDQTSLFACTWKAKRQKKNDKPKDVWAPPVGMKMKTKNAKESTIKDPPQ